MEDNSESVSRLSLLSITTLRTAFIFLHGARHESVGATTIALSSSGGPATESNKLANAAEVMSVVFSKTVMSAADKERQAQSKKVDVPKTYHPNSLSKLTTVQSIVPHSSNELRVERCTDEALRRVAAKSEPLLLVLPISRNFTIHLDIP